MSWKNHLRSLVCNLRRTSEYNLGGNGGNIRNLHSQPLSSIGSTKLVTFDSKLQSTGVHRPLHHYLQLLRISTSRQLLANSDATPISSPLTPLLGPSTGNADTQAAVSKPDKVQAVLKGIKQSPKKLNLVAAVVRGMRVEDALLQMQVTVKRAAKTVYQVIHSAQANATHNHSLDPDRLVVAEAYVGKGLNKKRVSFHAKGRSGIMIRPVSRLTVVVREMTPEEEAQLARLRVHNFKKLSKKEHRLVPHQLIESNPIWGRKNSKARSTRSETLD